MSDYRLTIAPFDPLFVPEVTKQSAALELAKRLRPEAHEWELCVSEAPEVYISPKIVDTVSCPHCHENIEGFFFKELEIWWNRDRRDLSTTTPCCDRSTLLNELDYNLPIRPFACFTIQIMHGGHDLEPEEREQFEAALGTPVTVFWYGL